MKYRKVTVIFSSLELDHVENELISIGVPGMTVSRAHGFGVNVSMMDLNGGVSTQCW